MSLSMTECARQFPSLLWWSRGSAALTGMRVAGGTPPLPTTLTGAWPPSPRDQLTYQTRHTEHPWAMLTSTSSTLAVGRTPHELIRCNIGAFPTLQVQHCEDDLPHHPSKQGGQDVFLLLVCSFWSRRLHQPQDLQVSAEVRRTRYLNILFHSDSR